MEIHVQPAAPAELRDIDEFRAFKVVAHGFGSAADLGHGLSALGRPADGDHVFIRVEWLREQAANATDPLDWLRRLDGMLDLAARHGWLDEADGVRAHVEHRDSSSRPAPPNAMASSPRNWPSTRRRPG